MKRLGLIVNPVGDQPLLVDTGDSAADRLLSGHLPVITGYHERSIYRVKA